jgi:subtilisin family serine protease
LLVLRTTLVVLLVVGAVTSSVASAAAGTASEGTALPNAVPQAPPALSDHFGFPCRIGTVPCQVGTETRNASHEQVALPADLTASSWPMSSSVEPGMRLLVTFRPGAGAADVADAVRSVDGWIDATIPALGVARIALPGGSADAFGDGDAVARVLAQHPAVASAEHDATVRLAFTPNDAYYTTDPYASLGQWGIRKALVDRGWDLVRGSPSITVAILDTGIDPDHPDLAGATVPGAAFITQPSSGCEAGVTRDDNSHGTHVAGIVAANGNNGSGVAGVAFGSKVMGMKVLDCTGVGSLSDVANGLVWAVDQGAKVVNLSLGSPFDSSTLRSAVSYASLRGVLVVSAAGNCGTTGDRCTNVNQTEYPAAYPEVISVGATDTDDSVAFFSSRNATVDVSAPGRRIVSTTPTYATHLSRRSTNPATLTYGVFSGTSQASPFVAGLAALILSQEPSLSPAALFERLRSTSDDLGAAGRDDGYGSGRVNAFRALSVTSDRYGVTYDTAALPKAAATGKPFAARIGATNTSSFTWRAAAPGEVTLRWSWTSAAGAALATPAGAIALSADAAAGAAAIFAGTITAPSTAGAYTLRLDLDRAGTSFASKGAALASAAVSVGSGFAATYAPAAGSSSAAYDISTTTQLAVTLTNTGTETWPAAGPNPVRLSYHWLRSGTTAHWDGQRGILPRDVAPGASVLVSVPVLTLGTAGTYTLRLDLVQEGIAWFSGIGVAPFDLTVNVRSAYVATYAVGAAAPVLLPGGRATIPVTVTNTGTVTWPAAGANAVRLASHTNDARGNVVIWDGARTTLTADLAPGASAKLDLVVDAPRAAGPYRVRIDLVREGIAWFSGLGISTSDVDLLVVPDFRAQLPGGGLTVSRANPVTRVDIRNTSLATWTTSGASPVNVSVHWFDASGNTLIWDGPRTALPKAVAPNETVTVDVRLGAPPAGAAFVTIDLVAEGVSWFGAGTLRAVTLAP